MASLPWGRLSLFALLVIVCYAVLNLSASEFASTAASSDVSPAIEEEIRPVFSRRIVAIGDLHGDLSNALKVLEMSGVISKRHRWTGAVDYLVQTGDIVDRCVPCDYQSTRA